MKLLYIFLLSFVVGSRRLSGYYNKICSICIINLPPAIYVNMQVKSYFFMQSFFHLCLEKLFRHVP